MNLLQLRKKFRDISGRHDLVNEDGSDNGADFFIYEGQKFLDRLDETRKSWGSAVKSLSIGSYTAQMQYCRAIKEVWAASATSRWQLEKMKLQDLISKYISEPTSERENGTPLYYSPTFARYIPSDPTSVEFGDLLSWLDISSSEGSTYNSIILDTPTEETLILEIKGLFYTPQLVNETDTNYWSDAQPMLLIMSAMRQLETMNRNPTGVKDWNDSIITEMRQLGYDLVEEIIAESDQMEG